MGRCDGVVLVAAVVLLALLVTVAAGATAVGVMLHPQCHPLATHDLQKGVAVKTAASGGRKVAKSSE